MSFTEKDKRVLIEVINHIHHAYVSDQAFKESESTSITLPSRLVRLTADVLEQTYHPGILNSLDKPEIELLLTSLAKAVEAIKGSLDVVIKALPDKSPQTIRAQLDEQVKGIEAMNNGGQTSPGLLPLIESAIPAAAEEPAGLQERYQDLSKVEEALSRIDLSKLREEVDRLEAAVGPRREELEQLQHSVSERTAELERLEAAVAEAETTLRSHDVKVKEQLENVLNVGSNLITAVNSYIPRYEEQIREAVETIAEKVSEGRRLKAELQARMNEISEVLEETARIFAVLNLYADGNRRVVRSVPAVVNLTKQKLSRIEEQLQEIDGELKQALEQHQSARHVVEVARV